MAQDVKLIDQMTGTELFSCDISEIEKAYAKAEEYEEMGLDVKLVAPSIPETLIKSLGAGESDINKLNETITEEIASHIEEEVGCVACLSDTDEQKNNLQ
ncbi:MAG: hypothetical protein CME69_06905 [Halobacteriovorax sp.]|nr:hypothetical protein [Halobacteriovorax sp.]|tara:strand:+ start:2653 stop:2952 length:300 start_codon:yes stop_codon:yes gene_type:complete